MTLMPQLSVGLQGPVRVLHLVSTFAVKTDTKWLEQLLLHVSDDRVESSIACMYGSGPMRSRFESLGLATFDVDAPSILSPGGLWRLIRLIRRIRPHVLHTHLLRADLYGGLAGRLAGVPVILTTQYAVWPYARVTARRSDAILDRVCRGLATHAICVSEAVRQDLIARVGWRPARAFTIRTGLDFDAWHPDPRARERLREEWSVPDDAPLVMTVARLSREKGIEVLIEAADLVRRKHPQVRFVLVGDGPLVTSLVSLIRERQLERSVLLAGFHRDIPSVLSAADLFVLPSHMEGMPNAVLEAFAAGLPVVATAVGGLPEVITPEQTGLLVPPRDPGALSSAIARLIGDKQLARRLAEAGSIEAKERHSVTKVAREHESLYTRLVLARRGQGFEGAENLASALSWGGSVSR